MFENLCLVELDSRRVQLERPHADLGGGAFGVAVGSRRLGRLGVAFSLRQVTACCLPVPLRCSPLHSCAVSRHGTLLTRLPKRGEPAYGLLHRSAFGTFAPCEQIEIDISLDPPWFGNSPMTASAQKEATVNATLTKPAVIATIDEVLNALAVYRERDAAIEDLELRIHVDRSHLLTSTATVELVEALDYYEKELSAELGEPSDGTRAAALEDIRDVLRARLLELTRPESVANPEQPSSPD